MKKRNNLDERIVKTTNEIYSKFYPLILFLTILLVIIKFLFVTDRLIDFLLEGIAIMGSISYILIRSIITGVPIAKYKDVHIKEIQDAFRSHGFYICFCVYVFGEFLLFIFYDDFLIPLLYIPVWFIPALLVSIIIIKKGLFVWGSKKAEKIGLKQFRKRVFIGSLFFGSFMGWPDLFKNGEFNIYGIFYILLLSVCWGVPFYFVMKFLINKSEGHADAILIESEKILEIRNESDTHEK